MDHVGSIDIIRLIQQYVRSDSNNISSRPTESALTKAMRPGKYRHFVPPFTRQTSASETLKARERDNETQELVTGGELDTIQPQLGDGRVAPENGKGLVIEAYGNWGGFCVVADCPSA